MGRRRLQLKGDVYESAGMWRGRWQEDQIDRYGIKKRGWSRSVDIGPSVGQGRFTKTQARRLFSENHLSKIDQNNRTPQSIMSVRDFIETRFIPEHVGIKCKIGGRVHYGTQLRIVIDGIPEKKPKSRKWVNGAAPEPARVCGLGNLRLRDVTTEHCQRIVSATLGAGYSVQYAEHVKNCISAIFEHAESKDWFSGKNPAKRVNLPEMVHASQCALSFEELRRVAAALDPMTRAMALCASLTSMNVAEMCGLKLRYVNLSKTEWRSIDGESLPPRMMAVRWQWTLGQLGTVKAQKRRRLVPIPELLADHLATVLTRKQYVRPDDYVFTVNGRPVDSKNLLRRRLAPLGRAMGIKLGWHTFRRTFDTLADQVGMSPGERQAIMGHSDASMTQRYLKTPSEQARGAVEQMGELLREPVN